MRKRFVVAMLAISSYVVSGLNVQSVSAANSSIVITQVQAGGISSETAAATKEFISIYNNTLQDVDVSNWCITNKTDVTIVCLTPEAANIALYLPSYSYATISSDNFATTQAYPPDIMYPTKNNSSGSIVAGNDTITLIDSNGLLVDAVNWTTSLTGGSLLQRNLAMNSVDQFVDTDNSSADFQKLTTLVVPMSGLSEVVTLIDLCVNIDGVQDTLPTGYSIDDSGGCLVPTDTCSNIDGLQLVVPDDTVIDADGLCIDSDLCVNLPESQTTVPPGYSLSGFDVCLLDLLTIRINEMLPNALGDDDGNEFIELYNPNTVSVSLSLYKLVVGVSDPKEYSFPNGAVIQPGQYAVFSDEDIPFTLVNSSSQVRLMSSDDQLIDEAPLYDDPPDGSSWARIDSVWQYTNQPTPSSTNIPSAVETDEPDDVEEIVTDLKPCASNQYRNPETNRCRLLVTVGATLTPCRDGQYRSEETNRCRSIASDSGTLTPCATDQERNPETNRCRLIASNGSELAPCKEGQERNPATNRCRNVAGSIPEAAFAVEPVVDTASGFGSWWALGGIVLVALAYAGWEWREEAMRLIRKLGSFSHSNK